jgi:hypothetical protein
MAEFDRRSGSPAIDWATMMADLDTYIADQRASLRLEEALRSVPHATTKPALAVALTAAET